MSEIDAATVVTETAIPVLEFGRGWMLAPSTVERAEALGLPHENPFGFWVNGRAGVLGDGDASKAAAAIGFMAPGRVRTFWEARPDSLDAMSASIEYATAAAEWGRAVLADVPESDCAELVGLCGKVTAAALPSVGMLFAGWRELPLPADPAGAATVALNVVRELRGGAHLSAVYAAGLGPVGAILSTDDPVRGGVPGVERFGWSGPFPAPRPDARAHAEGITNRILEPIYDRALTPVERGRFAELVGAARAAMDR